MKRQTISRKAKAVMAVLAAVVLCTAVISCAKPAVSGATTAPKSTSGFAAKPIANTAASVSPLDDKAFVNDPGVLGTWTPMTYTESAASFDPASKDNPALGQGTGVSLIFAEGGKTNLPGISWSKGVIAASYNPLTLSYDIRNIGGTKYLFLDRSGGKGSDFIVFRWTSEVQSFDLTTDNINLPFVNDPAVLGTWKTVDFVKDISYFDPAAKAWHDSIYLLQLVFREDGKLIGTPAPGKADTRFTWTKGFVLDPLYSTASAYTIKEIGGKTYMFYEWKSGDYVYRHMKPTCYVLEKVN